ncbi:methyltransferase domain-containing protein [Synechococcus sp. CBW1002]|jgi:SAM-dependent methyltransferase|uniref:methyltransferase domain-containing protein n=1 Tax=unclassified Synechococcus TaxID=2626047 RepID=UPI0018CEA624|nr:MULTISPECIES: methyltransferase domain-containing protein [unclassified Synechococcus]QPN58950.1 methyltransferase domain-containing protein [Synechococcus sp. CBW1002]QPN65655.1 methyltransferase domain-containing protein [Synechococcus sp. CBW1006]
MSIPRPAPIADPSRWDQRYREGGDGWELGQAAPPLAQFLRTHPLAPQSPGRVLVPGCGRGHEAALLEDLGFAAIGLDFSGEALREARRLHGEARATLQWLQADLFDQQALTEAGLAPGSLSGIVEHTCFCAIDPGLRQDYIATVCRLLAPGGWLLGLFWCHGRQGGPPWGSDPQLVEALLRQAGLVAEIWQPATGSVDKRNDEWLGLWRQPGQPPAPVEIGSC